MASSDGKMSQADIEALMASMNTEPERDSSVTETASLTGASPASGGDPAADQGDFGGMMSQAEIEALLNETRGAAENTESKTAVGEEIDQQNPNLAENMDEDTGGMSPEEEEAFLEALKKPREDISPQKPVAAAPPADPGGMMSQDEIAAMLAAMEPAAEPEKPPVAAAPPADPGGMMSQDEIAAMLAAMEPAAEPEKPPVAAAPPADPGGMMSQDEIAAMLAAMEPAAEPEKPPVAAAPPADPGGMMSQDEIAAMLAAMEPAAEPEKPPVAAAPPADPGGMMSQDEIAAMLAAMEPTAEPEKPPVAAAPPADPGGMMSQDEIAAMLAAMEPAAEPEKPPVAAEPQENIEEQPAAAPKAPGAMMSQDEIESMMAALNSDLEEETQLMQIIAQDTEVTPPSAAEAENVAAAPATTIEQPATADLAAAPEPTPPKKAFFLTALFAGLLGLLRRKKQQPVDAVDALPDTAEEIPAPPRSMMAKLKGLLPFGKKTAAPTTEEETPPVATISTADFRRMIIYLVAALALLLPIAMGAGTYLALTVGKTQPEVSQAQVMLARMGIGFYTDEFVKQAGRGNKEAVVLFMEAGMPPDSYRPADGFTPMMAAASYGKQDIVRALMGKGANPNVKDKDGQTALIKAVAANQALTVRTLIQGGADPNIKDAKGRTAISVAREKKDPKVIELMVDLGIKELEPVWQQIKPAERKAAPRASEIPGAGQKTPPSATQGQSPPINPPTVSGKSATEFGIFTGKVGFAELGKSVDSLFARYDKNSVTFNEELFAGKPRSVANVYLPGSSTPAFNINMLLYNQQKDRMIIGIQVFDERFRTESGVGVNSTLGDLRKGGGNIAVKYVDNMMTASAKESRVMYELDISMDSLPMDWLKGGDASSLPDNMRIRSIIVY